MGSDDNEDPDDFKKEALARGAGVQRAVWDLRYEGARKIKNARIDTGDPDTGPRVPPGAYTVRLTAGGKTLTAPLKVVPDPRGDLSQTDLEAQAAFAVRVRDDVSKLTDLVNQLRSVQEQLKARNSALAARKADAGIADLLGESDAAIKKAFAIEDKLHNPTAEVVYDILAMRGGARLYSRLSPLQMWALESNGAPTAGMSQVLAEQEKELAALETETKQFMTGDVSRINKSAAAPQSVVRDHQVRQVTDAGDVPHPFARALAALHAGVPLVHLPVGASAHAVVWFSRGHARHSAGVDVLDHYGLGRRGVDEAIPRHRLAQGGDAAAPRLLRRGVARALDPGHRRSAHRGGDGRAIDERRPHLQGPASDAGACGRADRSGRPAAETAVADPAAPLNHVVSTGRRQENSRCEQ